MDLLDIWVQVKVKGWAKELKSLKEGGAVLCSKLES